MTKNKSTLVKESVIRRWGKLANMPSLTENWLDTISEEDAEEEMEMDMGAEAADDAAEAGMDAEEAEAPAAEEEAAVERIVSAVVDAISSETGVDIEVEADGEMADDAAEMEMGDADDDDAAMRDSDPAMREPDPAMRNKGTYNKKDLDESETTEAKAKDEDEDAEEVSEDLNLEVVDDEALTEAVLKRVVERLLKRQ